MGLRLLKLNNIVVLRNLQCDSDFFAVSKLGQVVRERSRTGKEGIVIPYKDRGKVEGCWTIRKLQEQMSGLRGDGSARAESTGGGPAAARHLSGTRRAAIPHASGSAHVNVHSFLQEGLYLICEMQ